MAAAIRRAWPTSPLDRLARPQQPASSNRTRQPASSSSSIAARPAEGSVKVVKESAKKTSSPWVAVTPGPGRRLDQLRRSCRWNRGSVRAALTPSQRSAALRTGRQLLAAFDSGNAAEPSRFSIRMDPNRRERSGTPC
jgi:hypothetical protein